MPTKNSKENHDSELTQEEEYQVERIVKVRIRGGQKEYFLKWKGYSEDENTWEPASHLDCPHLIQEFEDSRKKEQSSVRSPVSSPKNKNSVSKKRTTATTPQKVSPNLSRKSKRSRPSAPEADNFTTLSKKSSEPQRQIKPIRGFGRGLTPDRIIGATDSCGELMFLIKWKGCSEADLVPAREANIKCPQIVIGFYEERLTWHTPGASNVQTQSIHTSTSDVAAPPPTVTAPKKTTSVPKSTVVSSLPVISTPPPMSISFSPHRTVSSLSFVPAQTPAAVSTPPVLVPFSLELPTLSSDTTAWSHPVSATSELVAAPLSDTLTPPTKDTVQTHLVVSTPLEIAMSPSSVLSLPSDVTNQTYIAIDKKSLVTDSSPEFVSALPKMAASSDDSSVQLSDFVTLSSPVASVSNVASTTNMAVDQQCAISDAPIDIFSESPNVSVFSDDATVPPSELVSPSSPPVNPSSEVSYSQNTVSLSSVAAPQSVNDSSSDSLVNVESYVDESLNPPKSHFQPTP